MPSYTVACDVKQALSLTQILSKWPFIVMCTPVRARGLSRECVLRIPACRKRRLNGRVSWNNRIIKRLVPCRCLDVHVKEPYEMSMALGARPYKCGSNYFFFFSPPAHLCAVTCITEILSILTLNNQFSSPSSIPSILLNTIHDIPLYGEYLIELLNVAYMESC